MRDLVNGWLREMGQGIGQSLGLDDNNLCSLQYDEDLEINVELHADGPWLYLHAPVARVAQMESAAFFKQLLKINLFGLQTDGATLGYDERTDHIAISDRVDPATLDGLTFLQWIESFVMTTVRIRGDIMQEMTAANAAAGGADIEQPGDGMMRV